MEAMDCDSPAYSPTNSDNETSSPSKNLHLRIKVKSLTAIGGKNLPSKIGEKTFRDGQSRFLKEKGDNDMEDDGFKGDSEDLDDKVTAKKKTAPKTKKELSRFLKRTEDKMSVESDDENDSRSMKNKMAQTDQFKARLSRSVNRSFTLAQSHSLNRSDRNGMSVDETENNTDKENKLAMKKKLTKQVSQASLDINENNEMSVDEFDTKINKEINREMAKNVSQNSKEQSQARLAVNEINSMSVDEAEVNTPKKSEGTLKKTEVQKLKGEESQILVARVLDINESTQMSVEESEDETRKVNERAIKLQKAMQASQARLARFMKIHENDMSVSEDELGNGNNQGTKRKVAQNDNSQEKHDSCETSLEEDIQKLTELSVTNGTHKKKEHSDAARLSRFLTMGEGDRMEEDEPVGITEQEIEEMEYALNENQIAENCDTTLPGCSKPFVKHSPPCKTAGRPKKPAADSDSDTDGEEGSLQAIRKANKARMKQLMNSLRDPELEKQFEESLKSSKGKRPKFGSTSTKRKRGQKDNAFRFHGLIPTEKRKSARLQNKNPQYTYEALDDVCETMRTYLKAPNYKLDDHLPEDLEDVVYKPKRKSHGKRKVEEHIIIPVEDVTQEMLDNIALRVKGKVYSDNGTTCHQCRQKTMDQKTCCRSPDCSGMLGMFCGVCIKNRYGEDAAEALLNPNWICPVCRGRCNCSICRTKQGKRPTGVLAPLAQQSGYESVDHYLDTLRGEGDRPQEDYKWKFKRDPEALLGFSENGRKAHFLDGSFDVLGCAPCAYKDCENPDNLLGFSSDGNIAIMGGYREEVLFTPKNHFFLLLQLKQI